MLSTSPRQQVPFRLKQLRPFSLLVTFQKADKTALDLTGASLRLVIAEQVYQGGAVLLSSTATLTSAIGGLAQFDIQGDDLDMAAGQYWLTATLESAEGFESTVFEGEVEVEHNADPVVPADYGPVVPPLGLTVTLRSANRITVRVNHVPDSVLQARLLETETYSDAAAASAAAAAASATDAETAVADTVASQTAAEAAAASASGFADNAADSATAADAAMDIAVQAQDNANGAATVAGFSASNAADSETAAAGHANMAANAQAAAEVAQGFAVDAAIQAIDAQTGAETAMGAASDMQAAAEGFADAAYGHSLNAAAAAATAADDAATEVWGNFDDSVTAVDANAASDFRVQLDARLNAAFAPIGRGVSTLTTAQRDALTGAGLWDGRIILNTTTDRLNRYDLGTTTWVVIPDNADIAALLATSGTPAADAVTAVRGTSNFAARADHVHPFPAYAAWTPTYANLVVGNGTAFARWVAFGKMIHFRWFISFGTTTAINASQITVSLPTAAHASGAQSFICRYYTTGTTQAVGFGTVNGSATPTTLHLYQPNGNALNNTVGFTTGSNVDVVGTYEAA